MKISIKHGQFIHTSIGETDVLSGVVRCDSFRNIEIPTNPNPRSFLGMKGNRNYAKMMKTLVTEPSLFLHKNASGITIFVRDYELLEDGTLMLDLDDERDGVCNGGHTLAACKNFGTSKAYVKMHVVKGLSEEYLVDVAEALNQSKRIEAYSLAEAKGQFDWFKESLGDLADEVSYHEGDPGLTDVREEIGALHVFLYAKDGSKRPTSAFRGSVNVNHHALVKFDGQESYSRQVATVARDVHELHRFIVTNQSFVQYCDVSHERGWKRRMKNGEYGLIRAVTDLILLGLASVGTYLDEEGVIRWKEGYQTDGLRRSYSEQMFHKVFDCLVTEDGTLSSASKRESVIERVVKQAEMLARQRSGQEQLTLI